MRISVLELIPIIRWRLPIDVDNFLPDVIG